MLRYGIILFVMLNAGVVFPAASEQAERAVDFDSGPTLQLSYTPEQIINPVDVFMYFIPLNSLSAVTTVTDPNTSFTAGVVSWHRKNGRQNSFTLICDFEVTGSGLYKVVYEPGGMIDLVSRGDTKQRVLTGLLDWIQFDGPCLGQIEASGRIQGEDAIIESVSITFNRGRQRSPVSIALYDIPRVENRYDYSNRRNHTIARVNTLTFRRSDESPRMNVEIASVQKAHQSEGLFSSITAMFANLLLSAQPVSVVGNDTMLEFGLALYHRKSAFTFPAAETLMSSMVNAQASAF